jgi:hypothetical protein
MDLRGGRGRLWRRTWAGVALGASASTVVLAGGSAVVGAQGTPTSTWPPDVFAVGSFNGVAGQFGTSGTPTVADIQAAVDAAEAWAAAHTPVGGPVPPTYVLLAPGDYKTVPSAIATPPAGAPPAGVVIDTANLWLVGMDRNSVVVDGTRSGPPCSTSPSDQIITPAGLNGVMVWKAPGVWVENLTVCNFLAGSSPGYNSGGNEIWWNGGANSGQVFTGPEGGPAGYVGAYLTATSTYFADETTAAQYGIFSSNWDGGTWDHTYASNFNDSSYYIGACQQQCNQSVDDAWAEYSALGYSGSNSGGRLLVQHSQFDHNEDGFDTNSQNGDNPPPQDGACPPGVSPPTLKRVPSAEQPKTCWVFYDNNVHDNNNPDVPTAGSAAAGPVGTGMSLSGARDDTVVDNTFSHNDAWGTILVPYPDSGAPCTGGTQLQVACIYDEFGDAVVGNTYSDNGSYGNPTNGDIAAVNLEPGPTDCFSANRDTGGSLTTSPPLLEVLYPVCTGATVPPDLNVLFTDEVACDSGSITIGPIPGSAVCLPGTNYPRQTEVVMHPLPGVLHALGADGAVPGSAAWTAALEDPARASLPTMPEPCSDVPSNPWC